MNSFLHASLANKIKVDQAEEGNSGYCIVKGLLIEDGGANC